MKIARFRKGRQVAYGVVDGDEIAEIRGSIFTKFRITDDRHKLDGVKLLSPTDPMQIWCPGNNFPDETTSRPANGLRSHGLQPWHKGRNSLIGQDDFIILPKDSAGNVHYQGEAVAVIGKICRRVTPAAALRYVLGYTCGNDVSERQWQADDASQWRSNGSDTFAPVGPWMETDIDPNNLEVTVSLNGHEVQRSRTRDMAHDFANIISYISQHVTLHPGDLVFSGTAGTTGPMVPEDVVEVNIDGIGTLRNTIRAES